MEKGLGACKFPPVFIWPLPSSTVAISNNLLVSVLPLSPVAGQTN